MKIAPSQPSTHYIQENLAAIYLLSGDEPLLIAEAKKSIYRAAAQHGFNHRETLYIDTANWQEFAKIAYNISLFAEKQIIELRFTQAKPSNVGSKLLIEYAQNPPQDNVLLLVMPKLDAASKKSQWFKTLEKKAAIIQVWPLEHKQLPSWITSKAKQLNLNIDYDCAKILADHTMGNLLAAHQELEKLSLLYGTTAINATQLISSLSNNARFNSFDLIDAIYTPQNQKKIITILEHLKAEDFEPTLLLWTITREIRLLINCKYAGKDITLLNQYLNSNNYKLKIERKNQIKQLINKLSLPHLEKMLCMAADIDQMIKGIKNDDVWRNLQQLMLLFAQ